MRRKDRQLEDAETISILENGEYGVLSTVTEDISPYGVPLNYAFDAESMTIYMHCSSAGGQKTDNLRFCPKACFTIVYKTELMPEDFGTKYWSANVFGNVSIVDDTDEKQKGIEAILRKYSPDHVEKGLEFIRGTFDRFSILKLDIRMISGKARKQ
ncbi:MAG: pyridoxamine 5'-phosphate oxidase family protein [Lachnospiraceae bacterium]|nr:pyridoxamine 5'-phosphate oxidase family protein [Lachnospiraceae bacterium]